MKNQDITKLRESSVKAILKIIDKLESDYLNEASNNKSEGQKKKNQMKKIRKELAVSKTILNEKLYEKAKDE